MASQRRSKSKRLDAFFDVLPKTLNALLLLGAVLNFLVIIWAASKSAPKVVHTVDTVCTNFYFTVTSVVERVAGSSSASSSSVDKSAPLEVVLPYHYMVVDGVPMIRFYGRNFKEGDLTSYGRISSIFPDRVKLDGEVFLKNSKNPDELVVQHD